MKQWCVACGLVLLAGCTSSEATPTSSASSASIAAPTTPQRTTPTTAVGTTPATATAQTIPAATSTLSPPTSQGTAASDEAAIIARYEAFSAAADRCFEQPQECQLPDDLVQYANPETDPVKSFTSYWIQLRDTDQRVTASDRIHRDVTNVKIDGSTAVSTACIKNAAITVDAENSVVDERIGYWREDFVWKLVDGTWMIQAGSATGVDSDGATECAR